MKQLSKSLAACPICDPDKYDNAPIQIVQCSVCGFQDKRYTTKSTNSLFGDEWPRFEGINKVKVV